MTDPKQPADEPSGVEEIRADVERTRAELADTVDRLSDKLDVKAQAGRTAESLKESAADKAAQAKAAAPEPVQHAIESVGAKTGPIAHQVNEQTRPHRGKIIAGVAGAVVLFVVIRRRRRS